MLRTLLTASILYLLGVGHAAFAQQFHTYTLQSYPTTAEACTTEAQLWGVKLSAAIGAEVFSAQCIKSRSFDYRGYDIEITYSLTGTHPPATTLEDRLYGSYSHSGACNQDLEYQIELFQIETGLDPFAAYCNGAGYLFLKSFGTALSNRHLFNSHLGGEYRVGEVLIEDQAALKESIKSAITNLGGAVANVFVRGGRVYLYYYAPKKLHLSFSQFTSYSNDEDCQTQADNALELFSRFGGQVVFQICASTVRHPVPEKSLFNLIATDYSFFWPQIYQLYMTSVPQTYPDLRTCLEDQERVEAYYFETFRKRVFGSICSLGENEPSKYAIQIFQSNQ